MKDRSRRSTRIQAALVQLTHAGPAPPSVRNLPGKAICQGIVRPGAAVQPLHIAAGVFMGFLWGIQVAAVKIGAAQLPPLLMVGLRFVLIGACWPRRRWPNRAEPGHREDRPVHGELHFGLVYLGISRLDATTAAICSSWARPSRRWCLGLARREGRRGYIGGPGLGLCRRRAAGRRPRRAPGSAGHDVDRRRHAGLRHRHRHHPPLGQFRPIEHSTPGPPSSPHRRSCWPRWCWITAGFTAMDAVDWRV